MKKKENNDIKIKYFILGIIFTIAIGAVVFGTIKLIDKLRSNNSSDNNKVVIDDIEYTETNTEESYTCDAFKDTWFWSNNYLVTNSGYIYKVNTMQKFTNSNQNCTKALNSKIKAVIDEVYVDYNNKIYRIDYDGTKNDLIEIQKEEYDNAFYKSPLFSDDIKMARTYKFNDGETTYIVLKNDGKLYKYVIKYVYNSTEEYKLVSDELFYEVEGEKINNYSISNLGSTSYIRTDKAIYTSEVVDSKCEEYEDVECEYRYVKNKYLTERMDDIVKIDYANNVQISYNTRTNGVYVEYKKVKGD